MVSPSRADRRVHGPLKIQRWVIMTVGLYALSLGAVWAFALGLLAVDSASPGWAGEWLEVLASPYIWILVAGMSVLQALALFLPARALRQRPIPRQDWKALAVVAGFLLSLLCAGLLLAIGLVVFGEGGDPLWAYLWLLVLPGGWIFWAWLFWRCQPRSDPCSILTRFTNWLLRGSIAEMLVAVPCHVYVRNRNDCCAPLGTFSGFAAGLAIMLFSLGPGVLFLFAFRAEQLRKAQGVAAPGSGGAGGWRWSADVKDAFLMNTAALAMAAWVGFCLKDGGKGDLQTAVVVGVIAALVFLAVGWRHLLRANWSGQRQRLAVSGILAATTTGLLSLVLGYWRLLLGEPVDLVAGLWGGDPAAASILILPGVLFLLASRPGVAPSQGTAEAESNAGLEGRFWSSSAGISLVASALASGAAVWVAWSFNGVDGTDKGWAVLLGFWTCLFFLGLGWWMGLTALRKGLASGVAACALLTVISTVGSLLAVGYGQDLWDAVEALWL